MIREEQINNAAFDYADTLELPENRFDYEDIEFAFQRGAEWADTHPINVWHHASEEPMDRKRAIVLYGTSPVVVTSYSYEDILSAFGETWYAYVILSNISLWAYLDELLPKGGER